MHAFAYCDIFFWRHTPSLPLSLSLSLRCADAIKAAGGASSSAYVTHAVFPTGWSKFSRANGGPLEQFYVTNSNPIVTDT